MKSIQICKFMKILFIGLGSIGQRHLRVLKSLKLKGLELYAYREINRKIIIAENLKSSYKGDISKKYKIKELYKENEIVKLKPDVTFICNPSSKHIKFANIVAKLKSDIFIEKPLSNNLVGLKSLIKTVNKNKLVCTVGYQMRFHPLILDIKKIIDKKKYGNLKTVKTSFGHYLPSWHKYENYKKVIYGKKNLGGGIILEMSHEIDYLNWLLGGKLINSKSFFSKISNLDINVEDIFQSLLIYKKDNSKILVNLSMDFIQKLPERKSIFLFEKKIVILDLIDNSLTFKEPDKKKSKKKKLMGFNRDKVFKDQIQSFLINVKKRSAPKVNLNESYQLLKLILKIKNNKFNKF